MFLTKHKHLALIQMKMVRLDISLQVKNDEVLVFSHISYAIKSLKKSEPKKNKYILYLTRESEQLDEVVLSVFKGNAKTNRIAEQIAVISC